MVASVQLQQHLLNSFPSGHRILYLVAFMVIDAATNQELCRNRLVVYRSVVEPQCCVKRQEKRPISELSSALPGAHLVALLACSEAGHGGQTRRFLRSPRDWRMAMGDGRPKSVPWQRKAPEGAPSPPWLRLDHRRYRGDDWEIRARA